MNEHEILQSFWHNSDGTWTPWSAPGPNPDPSFSARMSPSAECGHWSIFTLSKNPRREVGGWLRAQRQGLPLQRLDLGLQLGDALTLLAHVAMTMQSPLSPAADMPPDGPGQQCANRRHHAYSITSSARRVGLPVALAVVEGIWR
jgi:hypothetical protein